MIQNGSLIRIVPEVRSNGTGLSLSTNENRIIACAFHLQEEGKRVIFISKDFSARIKAEAVGVEAQDYRHLKFSYEEICKGIERVEVSKHDLDLFYKDGFLPLQLEGRETPFPNHYYLLDTKEQASCVAKYNRKKERMESLLPLRDVWGVQPLNIEQRCALDLLLRDDVSLVSLVGVAGTGKTLLALAAGLRKSFDEGVYSRILVSRPIMPLGKDIGYLPGSKEEKLSHWMRPIQDNLEFLCQQSGGEPTDTLRWILDSEKIELEAVTYIRGRTLARVYMIIDEAQNLTPHEVKTIISRSGKGSKVILTGDPTQIDNPYLDKDSNGLTYTVTRFRDYPLFGHVFLEKTERSELAALAAEVM